MFNGIAGGGAEDLPQLQSTMRAIELACSYIQINTNPAAAEATILSLHQSPQPYKACRFILENSQVASARFQAAAAIKEAAIREWSFLSTEDKGGLISFCLGYVIQHANSSDAYVFSKVSSVAAFHRYSFSRILGNDLFRIFFFWRYMYTICMLIVSVSQVSEFSPSTSSAMSLPREFHENCRKSLEQNYLKTFYSWAQDAALSVTNKIVESNSDVPEVKVCNAALRLMHQILNWEFRYSKGGTKGSINVFSDGMRSDTASSRKTECVIVQPGASWCDVLLSSSHVGWLINLYSLRQKFAFEGYWLDCPVAVSARKLIVQLCSLAGETMHRSRAASAPPSVRVLPWIDPPDVISKEIEEGRSGSEMIDGCRALLSIATVTIPVVFDRLLRSIRPFGTLTLLSLLMGEVVKVLLANSNDKETWSYEARDILLDTWTTLLASMDGSGVLFSFSNLFTNCNFTPIVASASATTDEDDADCLASVSAMDERLGSYALIARAAVDATVPFLTKLFSDRVARLHQGRGTVDPTDTLEEVYSLLLIIGHVLADEGEGETALVPDALQTHFVDVVEAGNHPVVLLSSSIVKFAEQCLDANMRSSIFSPRLMEAVIWFLARWSFTYLMLVEDCNLGSNQLQSLPSRACLFTFFNEHNQGKFVLDIIVRISLTSLMSYPGEKDLQELTCHQLLHALVRRRNICFHLLSLDSWRNLANAFANDKSLFLLNGVSQRSLAQTLVLSAYGMQSSDASNQYVKDLMAHMTSSLVDLANNSDLKNLAQQPDIIMLLCIRELRGAASATEPRTQRAIYEMGLSVMNPVLRLLEVYKHESAVIYLLLKFVVDWVDGQISYLEAHETAGVVNFCMSLLQIYSSHNIGKISLSLSSTLLNEAKTEKYKDLRALLQLLSHLCSKDMVDFSSDSIETQSTNISQVVFFGLHIITPLITLELLKYPKLCFDYFSLISHMLEVYPETLAQLNSDAFNHVLTTVDFGLHQQDVDIVTMCLRALKALASYHYKETKAGNTGLGSHAAGQTDPNGVFHEGILSRFLRTLLQFLLFEDYSTDLVSTAADALFPLILCEPNLYQGLGNELIEKQGNPNFKTRLANALQVLTTSNQLSSSLDRLNYQRFRKNLNNFLIEVRGFLKTK
ncbi:hypothetical protein Bca52824_067407 [Brassica carinata]|uniref:Exportin-4 n=1 Tax=Brassica carinata TaxID=52824 RepID=A0A8X7UBR3_BRACI|nr:hypothetical protein Bca52824_067407 [Brassica carinata]